MTPLATTSVNWVELVKVTYATINRSVIRPLDEKGITARGIPEAIAAYAEFQQEHIDYVTTLRDAGGLLRHFSVTFLAMADDKAFIFEIAIDGVLKILDCGDHEKMFIVSATLEEWRNTIINFAAHRATRNQRDFAEQALLQFDKMGLGRLFENYSRQKTGPSGLILIEKR